MAKVAQKYQDELKQLKCAVEDWHDYFEQNNKRFDEFKRFVFETSLDAADLDTLEELGKPPLEFNVCEAYLSRLRGNFAEHEPSISVTAAEGLSPQEVTQTLTETIDLVEDHMREIFNSSRNDGLEYKVYTDCLAGGFSGIRVGTDYINSRSFDQKIIVEKVFDPTLMGFDPMARLSHKGDGNYCFELVPTTKEDFEARYGKDAAESIAFKRSKSEGFSWSYSSENGKTKVAMVTYFYKKVMKREKIAKLTNGKTILSKNYDDMIEAWNQLGLVEQAPQIINERYTSIERIYLYEFCENEVFKVTETSYSMLPLVFVDGNSVSIRDGNGGKVGQFTRPYLYHAKGIQKLKNFAGQTMASEIENMIQHKFMAAVESVPEDYVEAYKNPQKWQTMLYHAFYNKDPDRPLPPPQTVQRVATPPIVESVFTGADAVTQSILGSYDAQQGIIGNKDLSGKAIEAGAIQSDSAAKPYMMGYIMGLNRVAQIILDLIPKYYVTPRTIPVMRANGVHEYEVINNPFDQQSKQTRYEPESMQVKVKMGVNSSAQKRIALEYIAKLMSTSELFAEFINTEGLESLLENIEIRGIDRLKRLAVDFMDKRKQAAAAQADQPSPEEQLLATQLEIENQKTQQKQSEAELKHAQHMSELAIKQEKVDQDWYDILSLIDEREAKAALDKSKADAQMAKQTIELSRDLLKDADAVVSDVDVDIYE